MAIPSLYQLLFILQILHQSHVLIERADAHGQAFIQTDNELRYTTVDGIFHGIASEGFAEINIEQISEDEEDPTEDALGTVLLRFDPPTLDFREQAVGMLRTEKVIVHNPNPTRAMTLMSISGNTPHLHCSFFADKTIEPGQNTTFDVVFLPRDIGSMDNTLYIHTTLGIKPLMYRVKGQGTPNPYRLRPFLGARVPLNFSFAPMISMHNPHPETLQLLAMFTSGGDLHLELPNGEDSGPLQMWEIPPFETKRIMRASFLARMETNFTGYIRIRTNVDSPHHLLALPVEIEVTKSPGLFSQHDLLDFGTLRTFDAPRELRLSLINTGPKTLHIVDVALDRANDAVEIGFKPLRLQGNSQKYIAVATVTFKASRALHRGQCVGRVVVKTKSGQFKFSIPYLASVLHGSLVYEPNATRFFVGASGKEAENGNANKNSPDSTNQQQQQRLVNLTRPIPLTNSFNFSLVIHNVTLPAALRNHCKILDFQPPVFLRSKETKAPFSLNFAPKLPDLRMESHFKVFTNVSAFEVPFLIYNGKLSVENHGSYASGVGGVDLGTLGVGEKRSLSFSLANLNPIDIEILNLTSSANDTVVQLLPLHQGQNRSGESGEKGKRSTDKSSKMPLSGRKQSNIVIPPQQSNILQITVFAPKKQGSHKRVVSLTTEFERIELPIVFQTADGSLVADPPKIHFEAVYPGKKASAILYVNSSFERPMDVKSLTFHPNDTRFYVEKIGGKGSDVQGNRLADTDDQPLILHPNKKTPVGRIVFDSSQDCSAKDDCYVGLTTTPTAGSGKTGSANSAMTDGHPWLLGMSLPADLINTDQYLYHRLQTRWETIRNQSHFLVNVTIKLDTSQVKGFLFPAQARLHWPRLTSSSSRTVDFETTQVGNVSTRELLLENPGDSPVLVQVLTLPQYPNPIAMKDMIGSRIELTNEDLDNLELKDLDIFTLQRWWNVGGGGSGGGSGGSSSGGSSNGGVNVEKQRLEDQFGIRPHNKTAAFVLHPGEKYRVRLSFAPKDDTKKSSIVLIRNNLTIVEAVVLKGEGARGELRLKPGSVSAIRFDLTEFHLKNCDNPHQSKYGLPPNFSVRKTLVVRNTGPIPIYVSGYSFNGLECEGYNFRVLDCTGYSLPPNASRKIDIAFTPDFTLSHVSRVFSLSTTLGVAALNYTVTATVPPAFLAKCAKALRRPNWEPLIYYSAVSLMLLLFFCILVAAYFEGDRILAMDMIRRQQAAQAANNKSINGGIHHYSSPLASQSEHNHTQHPHLSSGGGGVFDLKTLGSSGSGGGSGCKGLSNGDGASVKPAKSSGADHSIEQKKKNENGGKNPSSGGGSGGIGGKKNVSSAKGLSATPSTCKQNNNHVSSSQSSNGKNSEADVTYDSDTGKKSQDLTKGNTAESSFKSNKASNIESGKKEGKKVKNNTGNLKGSTSSSNNHKTNSVSSDDTPAIYKSESEPFYQNLMMERESEPGDVFEVSSTSSSTADSSSSLNGNDFKRTPAQCNSRPNSEGSNKKSKPNNIKLSKNNTNNVDPLIPSAPKPTPLVIESTVTKGVSDKKKGESDLMGNNLRKLKANPLMAEPMPKVAVSTNDDIFSTMSSSLLIPTDYIGNSGKDQNRPDEGSLMSGLIENLSESSPQHQVSNSSISPLPPPGFQSTQSLTMSFYPTHDNGIVNDGENLLSTTTSPGKVPPALSLSARDESVLKVGPTIGLEHGASSFNQQQQEQPRDDIALMNELMSQRSWNESGGPSGKDKSLLEVSANAKLQNESQHPPSAIPSLTNGLKLINPPMSSSMLTSPSTLMSKGPLTHLSTGNGGSSANLPSHLKDILAKTNNLSLLGNGNLGSLYNHSLDNAGRGSLSFPTSTATNLSPSSVTSPQYLASMELPQDLLNSSMHPLQTPSSQQQPPQQQQIPDFSKIATTPPPLNSVVPPPYPNMGMMVPNSLSAATSAVAVGGYHDLPPPMFNHPPPPSHMTSDAAAAVAAAAAAGLPSSLSRANGIGAGLPPQLATAYMQQQFIKSQQAQHQHPIMPTPGLQDMNLPGKRHPPIPTSDLSYNLLQRMQMQRRAERKEYQERRLVDENWPGFGGMVGGSGATMNGMVDPDSLWDPAVMSTDPDSQWLRGGGGAGLHIPGNVSSMEEYDSSIWSSGGSGATIWSPVGTSSSGSRWFEGPDGFMAGGGNGGNTGDIPLAQSFQQGQPAVPPQQPQQQAVGNVGNENGGMIASNTGLFNPFDSLRNIWGQQRSAPDSAAISGMVAASGGNIGVENPTSLETARRKQLAAAMEHEKQQLAFQQMQVNEDPRLQQQQQLQQLHQMHLQQAGEDVRMQQMHQAAEDVHLQQALPKHSWGYPEPK